MYLNFDQASREKSKLSLVSTVERTEMVSNGWFRQQGRRACRVRRTGGIWVFKKIQIVYAEPYFRAVVVWEPTQASRPTGTVAARNIYSADAVLMRDGFTRFTHFTTVIIMMTY